MNSKMVGGVLLALVILVLGAGPSVAQLRDSDVAAGIDRVVGQIGRTNAPLSVQPRDIEDDARAIVFLESENFTLTENIVVDIRNSGSVDSRTDLSAATRGTITTGTEINSYFLVFDPTGFSPSLPGVNGSIHFDQDVLGLMVRANTLDNTSGLLGADRTRYGDGTGVDFSEESVTISNDRRTVRFNFRNNAEHNEVRIITLATGSTGDGSTGSGGGNNNNNSNAPNARGESVTTDENRSITIDVLDNDTDPNDNIQRSSLRVTNAPDNGTTSINSSTREITYDPDNNFTGTDTFEYEICDTGDLCDRATVTVTVGSTNNNNTNAPNARNDSVTTNENRSVTIDVLDNDTDSNNNIQRSSLRVTSSPDDGTTSINSSTREITYDPDNNFRGTDSFQYEICDTSDLCDRATVTVTVRSTGSNNGSSGGSGGNLTLRTLLPEADDCSDSDDARIDIVPGNRENEIRMDDETGFTPVAILSTRDFPAPNCVDVSTVTFGPSGNEAEARSCGVVNVNFDRWDDVVCDFKTSDLMFNTDDDTGTLEADTIDGDFIDESDDVSVLMNRRPKNFIPARGNSSLAVKAQQFGSSLFLIAQEAGIASLKIQVFNAQGQNVFRSASEGRLLRWDLRSAAGQALANGVYIYVVTALDSDGNVVGSSIHKIGLIR